MGKFYSFLGVTSASGFGRTLNVDHQLRNVSSSVHSSEISRPTMDPTDTAPDSWEQEDDVEATVDGQLDSALTALNVNAKPFVPNVNAAEFVPAFFVKGPSENPDSGGKFSRHVGELR